MSLKHWFIAIQQNYWGRGESEKQAKANMRKAGGKGRSSVYMARQKPDADPPYVDMMGTVCHFSKKLELVSGKDVLGVKPHPDEPPRRSRPREPFREPFAVAVEPHDPIWEESPLESADDDEENPF